MRAYYPYTKKRLESELHIRGYSLVVRKNKGPLNVGVRSYLAVTDREEILLATAVEKTKPDWRNMVEVVNSHTRTIPVETLKLY